MEEQERQGQVGTEDTNDESARQQDEARQRAIDERDAANEERRKALESHEAELAQAREGSQGQDAPGDVDQAAEPQSGSPPEGGES